MEHAVDLLAAAAGVAVPASRRHLEAALAVSGGVSIFIDGVDEVSPFFKDRVLRLLTVLKQNTDNPIWVSCRPEVEASLQQEIGCSATRLRALSREEQRSFLCGQWAAKHCHLPASEFASFADKTIDALSEAMNGLLGLPLHLSMAAEVLAADALQSPNAIFHKNVFILLRLYRHFIQTKEDIYLQKHGVKDMNWENLNIRDDFKKMHQNCAMLVLLSDSDDQNDNIQNFKTYVEENMEALKKEKSGVLWVDDENNLRFAHFTFAEFFCALWLFEHRVTKQAKELVKYFYLKRNKSLAVRFLDLMLVEESRERVQLPLHEALLAGDGAGLARALEEGARADAVDAGGRTALHLAVWRRNGPAMEALLEAGCDTHRPDSLLGWTPMHYVSDPNCGRRRKQFLYRELCLDICKTDCAKVALWLLGASEGCLYGEMLVAAAYCNARNVSRSLLTEWDVGACGAHGERPKLSEEAHEVEHRKAVTDAMREALIRKHEEIALELLEHVSDEDKLIWDGESALHLAARGCLLDITKRLLKKLEYASVRDRRGKTPLHEVFENDYILVECNAERSHYVQQFLEMLPISMHPDLTNARDNKERTPLHLAVEARHVSAVEKLLACGSDVNAADNNKHTPLHVAMKRELKKEDAKVVKVLLDHGANPSLIDLQKQQPLSYLYHPYLFTPTEEITKKIVTALLEKQADPNCRNIKNKTLLHLAFFFDHLHVIKVLLKNGAHPNVRDRRTRHPLHYARSSDAVRLHLETANDAALHGQDEHSLSATDVRDERGRTPLHMATLRGDVEAMTALKTYGADPNSSDNEGCTPLHLAAQSNSLDAVKLLIEAGSDPASRDHQGQGPLNYVYKKNCCEKDSDSFVALLLQAGSTANLKDESGRTPLHHAVRYDHKKVAERLLAHNALVDVADNRGRLPLHCARSAGAVALLLGDGARRRRADGERAQGEAAPPPRAADANAPDRKGRSPLHLAALRGTNERVVRALVAAGSDPNARDCDGRTPLHMAVGWKNVQVVRLLLDAGARYDALDNRGIAPLNYLHVDYDYMIEFMKDPFETSVKVDSEDKDTEAGECFPHVRIASLLLERGADPSSRDDSGRSALHHAALKVDLPLVLVLVDHQADVELLDNRGQTARDLAQEGRRLIPWKKASFDEILLLLKG